MADGARDDFEELIDDELCAYQRELSLGATKDGPRESDSDIPPEIQPDLNRFRYCLDLLHRKRTEGDFPIPMPVESAAWGAYALPSRIGRFEIAERLGVGGFGIVFRGFDPIMKREVAIKIPRPEFLGSAELAERFASEATAVAQLEHSNIVPVYESDCYEIVPYLVMPFIKGATLAQWRGKQTSTSHRTAAEIVRQLACAVAHAHERGVLHRDLKPGNVLLAPREMIPGDDDLGFVPKLTDFGMAKCAHTARPDSRTGAVIGTVSYMSPEQAEGRNRDITARSDIYGLGVILYELISGAPPFRDTNQLSTIHKVLRDEPPTFRSQKIKVPIDLEVICLKCLEKLPANRYGSATALADDLQKFLNGEAISARPISFVARLAKWSRRNPGRAMLISVILVGLLVITAVSSRYNSRLRALNDVAESERRTRREHEMIARRRAYVSDMRNAKVMLDHGNVVQMRNLLDRHRPKPKETDLRDFAWWQLRREYDGQSRALGSHASGTTVVAMTPDGRRAASGGSDGVIRIWTLPEGQTAGELKGHKPVGIGAVSLSPDGQRLASAGQDGTVRSWNLLSFEPLFVRDDHHAPVSSVAYSRDGRLIASGGGDRQVRLWSASTGELVATLSGHGAAISCVAFHPTEDLLVSGGKDGQICFWNCQTFQPDARINQGVIPVGDVADWPCALAFDREGRNLDVGVRAGNYQNGGVTNAMLIRYSLDAESFGKVLQRRSVRGNPASLARTADGALISALGNNEIHISDPLDPNRTGEWKRGHERAVDSIDVSADGSAMISAAVDGQVRYWPDLQQYSRIEVAREKGAAWNDDSRVYELQWRNQFLVADFHQQEVALYRMPERVLYRAFPKSNDDGFVLSPSGNILLLCQMDGVVKSYRTGDGQLLGTLELSPRSHPFHPDFAAIDKSDEHAILAWNHEVLHISPKTPQVIRRLHHPGKVWQVTFSDVPNASTVPISTCQDGYVRFWAAQEGRIQRILRANHGQTFSVTVSEDRKLVATAGEDNMVRVWTYHTLEPVVVLPCNESAAPMRIGFLQGAKGFDILVRQHQGLRLWRLDDDAELMTFPEGDEFGHLAVNPSGDLLAAPQHGWIKLIDGRKGEP